MIQSGRFGRQNGHKLWSWGGCIYKIEMPIYHFFRYFFFGIRYFSVFAIPTSVSVFWNTSVFAIGYRPTTNYITIDNKQQTKLLLSIFVNDSWQITIINYYYYYLLIVIITLKIKYDLNRVFYCWFKSWFKLI